MLDRYGAEIWRVTGVLDAQLKKSGGEWLVGDKCSYADLAFVPWYWLCPAIMGEGFDKVSSVPLCGRSGRARCADSAFPGRNGSPSTRLASPGTRRCRPGLRSRSPERRGRRPWASNRGSNRTGQCSRNSPIATSCSHIFPNIIPKHESQVCARLLSL